ncbi:MAG: hypothetical protein ABIO82_06605 [Ginsengibacter sp.]
MYYRVKVLAGLMILSIAFFPMISKVQADHHSNKEWVKKSNEYTQILIDIDKKYSPEFASNQGLASYDTLIGIPTVANIFARRKEMETAVAALKATRLLFLFF